MDPTDGSQEPRYLSILRGPVLCARIWHGPDLCPHILHGTDLSVLLHRPNLCSGICQPVPGLHGLGLRPYILPGRPSLEFRQQDFG